MRELEKKLRRDGTENDLLRRILRRPRDLREYTQVWEIPCISGDDGASYAEPARRKNERETTVEDILARVFAPNNCRMDGQRSVFQCEKPSSAASPGSERASNRHDREEVQLHSFVGARKEGNEGAAAHHCPGSPARIQDQCLSRWRRYEGGAGAGIYVAAGLLVDTERPNRDD